MGEVIVTGTRSPDRTALQSAVPVDVISAQELAATGYTDLGRALEFSEPSANFPRPQTTPSAANTRAITLRGLSPDQVLVLVNGKRWHTTAVINVNFAVGRGSAPFDLSTIPVVAVDHLEVLKDGAAAQYGSDAIAGVVNIILKHNDGGGLVKLEGGATERGDGENYDVAANHGFALGGGYLSLSGEANYQGTTNRAAVDGRYNHVTFRIGDPLVNNFNLAASLMLPFAGTSASVYDDAIVSRKDSTNAGAFVAPGVSTLHPIGYLPLINPVVWDAGNTFGIRGVLDNSWNFDLSNTFGYSRADFTVRDSANATLGAQSPTEFDAGSVTYRQDTTDATLTQTFPVLAGATVTGGAEFRYESYNIDRGDAASTTGAGSSGFPGFNPRLPVDNSRNAGSGFVEFDLKPTTYITLDTAGRYDHYNDFGGAATWKISARVDPTEWVAFRSSVSTGFRAPSLQQEYYSSITTVANGGANKSLVNVGTFQVGDPVARALGAQSLSPEKSHDYSAGIVLTPLAELTLTADIFRVDISHRIALSDALSGAAVIATLTSAGITNVQQAAFFTNAFDTRTQGYDIDLNWRHDLPAEARMTVDLGFSRSPTTVLSHATDGSAPAGLILNGAHSTLLLTQSQPTDKLNAAIRFVAGRYTLETDITRFGEYTDAPISTAQTFGAKTVVDLLLSSQLGRQVTLTLGVINAGDAFPDKLTQIGSTYPSYKTFGGSYLYGEESPWGTDGRSYFARVFCEL